MRRTSFIATVVLFTSVLSMAGAGATPPTGDLKYEDYARAQLQESASVPINGGTGLVRALYSVAPGGKTGWRRLPGPMVLAVTKGKLMLHGGDACGAKEYAAGQAAVAPAGVHEVHNPGNEPLEFFGLFFDQAPGAPKPLAEGPVEAAPSNCTGVMAAAVTPSGVSLTSAAVGSFVTTFYSHGATLDIKAGDDVFATHYDVSPGWSSGWFAHKPAVNVMEAGDLSYVEAKDGKCDESEVYHGGEAFYHPAHRHMAVNEGKDHVLLTTVYFGVPHDAGPPGPLHNQLAAADFSQAPPADCPRLR
jgi:quercetin dioxygenase-like cupin family protein